MGEAGEKLIGGFREALAIAKGEVAAARITQNGHSYVPETPLTKAGPDLLNALTAVMPLLEAVRMQVGFGPTQMKRIELARTAISKARGEPSPQSTDTNMGMSS